MPTCISKLDNTLVLLAHRLRPRLWACFFARGDNGGTIPPEWCHGEILCAWAGGTDGDSHGPCPPAAYTVLLQRQ